MLRGTAVDEQQAVGRREHDDVGARAFDEREVRREVGHGERTGRSLSGRETRPAGREQPRGRTDQRLPACNRCLHSPSRTPLWYPLNDT